MADLIARVHPRTAFVRGSAVWVGIAIAFAAAVAFALLNGGLQPAVLIALVPAAALVAALAGRAALNRRALGYIFTWAGLIVPHLVVEERSAESLHTGLVTPLNLVQGVGPAIFLILAWSVYGQRLLPLRKSERALLIFGAVCVFSAIWSLEPLATTLRAGQLVVTYLLLILLVRQIGPPTAVVRHLVGAVYVMIGFVVAGAVAAPGSALAPEAKYDAVRQITVEGQVRLQGALPVIHPNLVGFLATMALLALVAGFGPRWSLTPLRQLVIGIAASGALVLSGTRSAILLLAVGLVVLAIVDRLSRSRVLVIIGVAVVAFLVIPGVQDLLAEFARRGQDAHAFNTLTGRTETWTDALALWGERPLTGYGYYAGHRFQDFAAGRNLSNLDNMYIETLVDVGVIGLCALLAFLAIGIRGLVGSTRGRARSLSIAIVMAAVVGGLVNPSLQIPGVALTVAGGLLLAPWAPAPRLRWAASAREQWHVGTAARERD